MAHSGSQSVKMTTQARTTDGIKTAFIELAGNGVFPVAGNVFYGRMMINLDAAPSTSVHWTMIQGAGVVPGATYHALYRYGGQLPVMQGGTFVGSQLMANYDTPDSYSRHAAGQRLLAARRQGRRCRSAAGRASSGSSTARTTI